MVTDWRQNETGDWIYNNGPGNVSKNDDGYYWSVYDGANLARWLDVQNAMYIVEMKHREVTLAAEVKAVEGLS